MHDHSANPPPAVPLKRRLSRVRSWHFDLLRGGFAEGSA